MFLHYLAKLTSILSYKCHMLVNQTHRTKLSPNLR